MRLTARAISAAVNEEVRHFESDPPPLFKLDQYQELETKLEIISLQQVSRILDSLKKLGVLGYEHRSEAHRVHSEGDQFGYVIAITGTSDIWVKIKSRGATLKTKRLGLPLLLREGRKFRPNQPGYEKTLQQVSSMPQIGTFLKECHNVFFSFKDHIFSLSLSLAEAGMEFRDYQLEFEYEGHRAEKPSLEQATGLLEQFFEEHLMDAIRELHTRTKGDILSA